MARLEKALSLARHTAVEDQIGFIDSHLNLNQERLYISLFGIAGDILSRVVCGVETDEDAIVDLADNLRSAAQDFLGLIADNTEAGYQVKGAFSSMSGRSFRKLREEIRWIIKPLVLSQDLVEAMMKLPGALENVDGVSILHMIDKKDLLKYALSGDPEVYVSEMPFVLWGKALGALEVRNMFFPQLELVIQRRPEERLKGNPPVLLMTGAVRKRDIMPFAFDHHVLLLKAALRSPNVDQKVIVEQVSRETGQGVEGLRRWFGDNIKKVRMTKRGRNWRYDTNSQIAEQISDELKRRGELDDDNRH